MQAIGLENCCPNCGLSIKRKIPSCEELIEIVKKAGSTDPNIKPGSMFGKVFRIKTPKEISEENPDYNPMVQIVMHCPNCDSKTLHEFSFLALFHLLRGTGLIEIIKLK